MTPGLTPTQRATLEHITAAGCVCDSSRPGNLRTVESLAALGLIDLWITDDRSTWTAARRPDYAALVREAVSVWPGVRVMPFAPFDGPAEDAPRVVKLKPGTPCPSVLDLDLTANGFDLYLGGWTLSFWANRADAPRTLRLWARPTAPWVRGAPVIFTAVTTGTAAGVRALISHVLTTGLILNGKDGQGWDCDSRLALTESITNRAVRTAARLLANDWTGTLEELRTTAETVAA